MDESDLYVRFWSHHLGLLLSALDQFYSQRNGINRDLLDKGKRQRFSRTISKAHWSHLYGLSPWLMYASCSSIFLIGPIQRFVEQTGLGRSAARIGLWNIENAEGNREWIPLAAPTVAAWRALDANLRAIITWHASMPSLISAGRAGDDEAYIQALRVDPAALSNPAVATRLSVAVAVDDQAFIEAVKNALDTPVRGERTQLERLNLVLWFLSLAGGLSKLTPERAYELFVVQLKLYPAMGRKDSAGSLWKHVQRIKHKLRTKNLGAMSS